ncbi:hypothetical protein AMAG_07253 [Allomyces macrogynus ATCC 38327]|uniref:UDENN domain-containing protein n=1 Tax=Allomyces macrogynus (strain ATCC 38327) TaxID=578462 RepID=A0A0L0SHL9_ALLM3|nr:hypothetical protein AMAG_07253 [Allomyces macrogynus ATCC 38327]|eukprot:KNE61993.1 hypothetical protein AMAG_07253 [Allomyces macrogynus ATCC 38327]
MEIATAPAATESVGAAGPGPLITHVLIATFHHTHGPIVEWAYPPFPALPGSSAAPAAPSVDSRVELPPQWSSLVPFCALPDGSHSRDACFNAFHLPPVPGWGEFAAKTVFATSCYRQISASELIVKTPDITRQMVQKAVVVLSSEPLYGAIRDKLDAVTRHFFEQKDFTNKDVIMELYENLTANYRSVTETVFNSGLNLTEFINLHRGKALVLLKLMMLQKKVMFFSTNVDTLINTQYSLVSLMPNLMAHLHSVGSPALDGTITTDSSTSPANLILPSPSTESQARITKRRAAGLPIEIFGPGTGGFFQPYLPLQQMDTLLQPDTIQTYMFGTTNGVLRDQTKPLALDAIVHCDEARIDIINPDLNTLLALTPPDKKWINDLVTKVTTNDSSYAATDDYIRAQFEDYLLAALATIMAAMGDEDGTAVTIDPSPRASQAPSPTAATAAAADAAKKDAADANEQGGAAFGGQVPGSESSLHSSPSNPALADAAAADPNSPAQRRLKLNEFHGAWVTAFLATRAGEAWRQRVTARRAELVAAGHKSLVEEVVPQHPCHGHTLTAHLNDKLQTKIAELHLDEKKQAIQASISSAVVIGGKFLEKAAAKVKEEAVKRQQQGVRKEEIVQRTTQAASKAKQYGVSLWGAATAYIATKRAEYVAPGADAAKQDAEATPKSESAGQAMPPADSNDSLRDQLYSAGADEHGSGKYKALAADDDA